MYVIKILLFDNGGGKYGKEKEGVKGMKFCLELQRGQGINSKKNNKKL